MAVSRRATDTRPATELFAGTLIFLLVAAAGLFYVKWFPYWNKAHVAATVHAIGSSIISGKSVSPPVVGWHAAWSYALAYFNAVWEAVILALVIGATVQVLVPRSWLLKLMGPRNAKAALIAGVLSMGGMMCTCCAGPIAVGLRRQRASVGSALAFFLGNPVLNPAVLVFMGFVLGWQFSAIRLVTGVLLIAAAVALANRLSRDEPQIAHTYDAAAIDDPQRGLGGILKAWLAELWYEVVTIVPGYVLIVLAVGAVRAFLFPPGVTLHAAGLGTTALLSLAGAAFVIPTAGEIPIVQTLMQHGMGVGPAVALVITLPAISLPSIFIVRNVFSPRVLAMAFGLVVAFGIAAGSCAMLLHLA